MKKLFVMTAAMILLLSLSGIAKYPVGKSPRRSSSSLDTKTWIAANQILMMQTNKGSFAFDQGVLRRPDLAVRHQVCDYSRRCAARDRYRVQLVLEGRVQICSIDHG